MEKTKLKEITREIDEFEFNPEDGDGLIVDDLDIQYFEKKVLHLELGAAVMSLVLVGATVGEVFHHQHHKRALAS